MNIAVGDAARVDRDRAETDAREDVGIVGLVDPNVAPSRRSGGNGLPVPIMARPSRPARMMSAGVASAREVGLDSGKMIGRSIVLGHRAHDRLGEGAGLARDADQHRRLGVAHDVEQLDAAGLLQLPIARRRRAPAANGCWNGISPGMPSTSRPSRSTR